MRRSIAAAIFAALAAVVANGCSLPGVACAPDDWRYCDCPSGKPGYQQCSAGGEGYGACDCSGAIPAGAGILVEAGAASDDAGSGEGGEGGDAGGLVGFLGVCTDNSQCVTNLCFPFNAYGPHCSMVCAKDTDCPAPSPGCSNMHACKVH